MAPPKRKLLAFADLKARGFDRSRRRINQLIADGKFPRPVRPGGSDNSRPAWFEDEIDAYLAKLAAERDAERPHA